MRMMTIRGAAVTMTVDTLMMMVGMMISQMSLHQILPHQSLHIPPASSAMTSRAFGRISGATIAPLMQRGSIPNATKMNGGQSKSGVVSAATMRAMGTLEMCVAAVAPPPPPPPQLLPPLPPPLLPPPWMTMDSMMMMVVVMTMGSMVMMAVVMTMGSMMMMVVVVTMGTMMMIMMMIMATTAMIGGETIVTMIGGDNRRTFLDPKVSVHPSYMFITFKLRLFFYKYQNKSYWNV